MRLLEDLGLGAIGGSFGLHGLLEEGRLERWKNEVGSRFSRSRAEVSSHRPLLRSLRLPRSSTTSPASEGARILLLRPPVPPRCSPLSLFVAPVAPLLKTVLRLCHHALLLKHGARRAGKTHPTLPGP